MEVTGIVEYNACPQPICLRHGHGGAETDGLENLKNNPINDTMIKFKSTYTGLLKRNPNSPEVCDIVTSPSGINHPALTENSETGN